MMTPKFSLSLIAGVIASALPYSTFAADQFVENQSIENQSAVNKVSNTIFDPVVLTPSQTDFGGVGLMQMPSGRMAPEGEFNIGASINNEYHHYNVSLQVMPWLETTIRYTLVQDLLYSSDESLVAEQNTRIKESILKFVYLKRVSGYQRPLLGFVILVVLGCLMASSWRQPNALVILMLPLVWVGAT